MLVAARTVLNEAVVTLRSPSGEEVVADDGVFEVPVDGRYLVRVVGGRPYQVAVSSVWVRPVEVDGAAESGELGDGGGAEYWSFEGTAGQIVRVAADPHVFGDTVISVLSPSGREVAAEDDGVFGLPLDGRYRVRVTASGPYQVAVSNVSVRPLEVEGAAGTGEVGDGGTAEYWSFEGAAGQLVRVAAGSGSLDTVVSVLSPGGEEIAANGENVFALPLDGRYLVRVAASGPYQVAVSRVSVRPLEVGGAAEAGEAGDGGRGDYWSFEGTVGQVVRVAVGSDFFDTVVSVLSPGGEVVTRDDDGGFGTDSLLDATLPLDGRYSVRIATRSGVGGPYQVAVSGVSVRALQVDTEPVSGELR